MEGGLCAGKNQAALLPLGHSMEAGIGLDAQ